MRLRSRLVATVVASAAAAAALVSVAVPGSLGAYTAKVTNSQNTVTTNPYFTCTTAATGLGSVVAWPLDDAGVLNVAGAARDVSGGNRTGLYTVGGVTYRQAGAACPRDLTNGQSYSIGLNGSSGYLSYTTPFTLDDTFTESVWFNTTTTRGGKLMGFGNAATGTSNQYDRHIWMNNQGQLYFGVYPNQVKTVNSSASYNDGRWHQAVATLGSTGMILYVDGVQVGIDATVTVAQTYSTNAMYLRIGYDNLDGWVSIPTSYYFAGSVRFADFFATTLTAAQVAALYRAGT